MKQLGTTLFATLLLVITPAYAETISDITQGVSINSYSNFHVGLFVADGNSRGFTDGDSPRVPAYQHDLARDFIHSNFNAMGYDTWLDPFTFMYKGKEYTNANNVVAIKQGTIGTNIYIVGAHYDSVDSGQGGDHAGGVFPGADDNASGTAAILETAKSIKDYTFRDTLIFIAIDAEEKNYKGSKYFVANHITNNIAYTNATTFYQSHIQAMINLDMIGYNDPANGDELVLGSFLHADTNSLLTFALTSAMTNYTTLIPFLDGGYNASDHLSFKDIVPSIHVIEHDLKDYWNNPPTFIENTNYHKVTDSIDQPGYISYPYATEATKCITGYLCEQAQVIPPATLCPTVTSNNIFEICWSNTPGVSYSLYGTDALSPSNLWIFNQTLPATNVFTELAIQIDLNTATQRIFKVFSE